MDFNYEVIRQTAFGSVTLRGFLEGATDDSSSKDALVVLCHGLMMRCDINPILYMAHSLNKAGYTTLRFDFSGTGISDGDIINMTPNTEVDDLVTVLKDCRNRFSFKKIFVLGHSLGGVVSSMTAGENPSLVDALVLLAPACNVEDDCRSGKVGYETFPLDAVPDYVEVWGAKLGRNYFLEGQNLRLYQRASQYKGPVCIIQGNEDVLVPLEYGQRLHEEIIGSEFHILQRGDHHFIRTKAQAAEIAISFFNLQ